MATYITRRLLVGIVIGLAVTGLLLTLIISAGSMSSGDVTIAELWQGLGTPVGFLLAGALIGGCYALFFRPVRHRHAENFMSGLPLGVIAWVVLGLTLFPLLAGTGFRWWTPLAAEVLPQLIAYLLQGALVGLVYGLVYEHFGQPLGLLKPEKEVPPISTRVVVVGGGYAGAAAAQTLEQQLGYDPSVAISIVSETNYLIHTPMLSEVTASSVNAQNIVPTLRSFFKRVQVVQGEVEQVDMARRRVCLKADARSPYRELPFDHVVLTVGGVPNFFGNEGVAREAFTFKSLEDAMLLRNQMIDMFERADFEQDVQKRRRMLTFVVAGGGFAGVELLGGMNDFGRGILSFYPNIPPEELRFILVHSRDAILPELSKSLGIFAQEKLEERGVEFLLETRVTGAKAGAVQVRDKNTKEVSWVPTETFVWTAGNKPSPVMNTLGLPLNRRGQIKVNTNLAVPDVAGLWAAGDCAEVPDLTNEGKPAPPTAQHAQREGKVLGYNVAASIKGKPLKEFNFKTLGLLAALGHQLAVAEFFGRYRFSGFLAWLMWRAIYLGKLPTLQKQVRVGLDWLLDVFFPSDIVQTIDFSRPSAAQRLQERQTMMGEPEK